MKKNSKTVGILAFQGGVIEHAEIIRKLGHSTVEVRRPEDFSACDGLIIPGGESTTIGFFLEQTGLDKLIKKHAVQGLPILGTCAGAIVLAKNVIGNIVPPHLGLLDITISRNAYGRQVDSFYADIEIPALDVKDLHAAFIRAPIIEKTGPGAKILGFHLQGNSKEIVLVQQGKILAATFHPELRGDGRLHEYFLSLI